MNGRHVRKPTSGWRPAAGGMSMLYYVLHVVVSLITVSAIEQKPLSVSQPQCGKNKRIILLDRRSRSSIMGSGANNVGKI